MKLDYGTQLSPDPIKLSVGGMLRKPTLRRIAEITFGLFNLYEMFLKCTPKDYYLKIVKNDGKATWDAIPAAEQERITMYDIILEDESLQKFYSEIFEFFFEERVLFIEGFFE